MPGAVREIMAKAPAGAGDEGVPTFQGSAGRAGGAASAAKQN